jgi:hypothetical protein
MMIAGTAQARPALEATTKPAPERTPVAKVTVLVIAAKCAERPRPRQVSADKSVAQLPASLHHTGTARTRSKCWNWGGHAR